MPESIDSPVAGGRPRLPTILRVAVWCGIVAFLLIPMRFIVLSLAKLYYDVPLGEEEVVGAAMSFVAVFLARLMYSNLRQRARQGGK